MKKYKNIIVIVILSIIICLMSSVVYAENYTGTSWDNLNENIKNGLSALGYNGNITEAFNAATTITEGRTVRKNYKIIWETNEKKYEATIKAFAGGTQYGAEVSILEDIKQEQIPGQEGNTLEIEKGEFGPYTSVAGVQSKIQESLENQGCPSQDITNGYNNKKTTNVDRGVSIKYNVTWQADGKSYTAYVSIWGGGTTFYGSMSVNSRNRHNSK